MSSHFAALTSLALAIFFSPEMLVLGLFIASDKKVPRLAAAAFGLGAIVGIAFATSIGLLIAHLSGAGAAADRHGTWPGFIVRALIAAALLIIGIYRAVNAARKQDIPDISTPEQKPSRTATWLRTHFPKLMRQFEPNADLPVPRRIARAGLAGFAICGLHPKVFPIAIAAGHQITQITDPAQRTAGIVLFAAISVIPALVPFVIETVKPGSSSRIKDGYERIMKTHGRWITAVLLIGVGLFVAHDAWQKLPTRHLGPVS